MLHRNLQRLVSEEDGMEMIEWAIVGVVFAVSAALFWSNLATNIDSALGLIEDVLEDDQGKGKCCD